MCIYIYICVYIYMCAVNVFAMRMQAQRSIYRIRSSAITSDASPQCFPDARHTVWITCVICIEKQRHTRH